MIKKWIKKVLLDEFLDIDSDKLMNMMGVFDNLRIVLITQGFQDFQKLTTVLREDSFSLAELSSK